MADQQVQMPGLFGGLMRYNEEYESRFVISPTQVIIMAIALVLLVIALKIFFPVPLGSQTGTQIPIQGLITSLLKF